MDVLKKLVEICFLEFCRVAGDSPCGCDGCPYGKYCPDDGECYEEYEKDKMGKLEKAGVTVQERISVKDRLPEDSTCVLARLAGGAIYQESLVRFVNKDTVTYWMPLPEAPKVKTQ